MDSVLLSALVCLLPLGAMAHEHGAGAASCFSLVPVHNTSGQPANTNPYILDVNVNSLVAGQTIQVTVRRNTTSDPDFEGFLVQARCVSCADPDNTILPGTFTVVDQGAKPMSCGMTNNSITHTDDDELTSISFNWIPPNNLNLAEGVQFRAVVAKDEKVWWTNIRSKQLIGVNPTPTAGGNPKPTSGGNPKPTAGGNPKPTAGGKPKPTAGGKPKPTAGGNSTPKTGGNPTAGGNMRTTIQPTGNTPRCLPSLVLVFAAAVGAILYL